METKTYLDEYLPITLDKNKNLGEPDFYTVLKKRSWFNDYIETPIVTYKHKQSLYDNLQRISDETDPMFGISVSVGWFDDK